MTRVRIPPTLRPDAGGRREVELQGADVSAVLGALVDEFPGLQGRILCDGGLATYVNVFVDGTDVRALAGLATPVRPDSLLLLLPAMAGG